MLGAGLVAGDSSQEKNHRFLLFIEFSTWNAHPLFQWVPNCSVHEKNLESLFKPRQLGPNLRVSDSGGLKWALRICISNRFPGDADTAGLGQPLP